jgi:hypothetical protein
MGEMLGNGCPFGVLAMHTPTAHHWVDVQSLSLLHDVPHVPVEVLQNVPAGSPLQLLFDVHLPHAPALVPVVMQYGLVWVGHGIDADVPLSPLQAPHLFVDVLQAGVVPVHWAMSVAEHWTQAPLVRHAGKVGVGQGDAPPVP